VARGDPTARFSLGSALIDTDPDRAELFLRELLIDYPGFREPRVALIALAFRSDDHAVAAERLKAVLQDHGVLETPSFRRLASAVASGSGAPGWIGAGADGRAHLAIAANSGKGRLSVKLDGTQIVLPARRPRGGAPVVIGLPDSWHTAACLAAYLGDRPLLGSPVSLADLRRVEGFVEYVEGTGLEGWAWHPADATRHPRLDVVCVEGRARGAKRFAVTADDESGLAESDSGVARRRRFKIGPDLLPARGVVRVLDSAGNDLGGSPVSIGFERAATIESAERLARSYAVGKSAAGLAARPPVKADPWRPLPVSLLPRPGALLCDARTRARAPSPRPLDIVIPVFRGAADFVACLASLRGNLPSRSRIVVVDDASDDAILREAVGDAGIRGDIVALRHKRNLGFPAAANTGMRHALRDHPRDVLLLNPDTLVPPGAVRRLAAIAYSGPRIGSVTPMTNDGTIVSYPQPEEPGPSPEAEALADLDGMFARANGLDMVELPTAVGFCMYIRHDCLAAAGGFRDDVFAQGYGEENEWCLRTRHLGWHHVAATGVFVAHSGGRSFGALKRHLIARNLRILNRLYPGYDAAIQAFIATDALAAARRKVDMARWRAASAGRGAIVIVTHAKGGGVERYVLARAAAIRADGQRAIFVRPTADGLILDDGEEGRTFPNLRFAMPAERAMVVDLLGADSLKGAELHHMIGHHPATIEMIAALGLKAAVMVHDFAYWCPRVTLTSHGDRYCGEPGDIEVCKACVRDLGNRIEEDIGVVELRTRSLAWLASAERVVVSCEDSRRRLRREFPAIRTEIVPWEDDAAITVAVPATVRRPASARTRPRIVVCGAIGPEKGYDVLLGCARDAASRKLPLEFVLVGFSKDDSRLLETGRIFVTGRFSEDEAVTLVKSQHGTLGFLPSVWPETWCYSLSSLWRAGLRVVAFDIGAQAERIRRSGAGDVVTLGMPIPRLNDFLVDMSLGKTARPAATAFVSDLPTPIGWPS
jgi:GT2 family glycosyltransferase/glycosyltransferase involved in cell wall biosynthesis